MEGGGNGMFSVYNSNPQSQGGNRFESHPDNASKLKTLKMAPTAAMTGAQLIAHCLFLSILTP